MPQDQQSGAAANDFGRATAPLIARAIGAKMLRKGSNEATREGKRIVIKCGGVRTSSVGVSFKMLENLDAVFGAFRQLDGAFEIISLPAEICRKRMTPTRSKGPSAGRVGMVSKKVFTDEGDVLTTIKLLPG